MGSASGLPSLIHGPGLTPVSRLGLAVMKTPWARNDQGLIPKYLGSIVFQWFSEALGRQHLTVTINILQIIISLFAKTKCSLLGAWRQKLNCAQKGLEILQALKKTSFTECRSLPLCPQNGNLHFKLASHYLPCHFKGKLVFSVETFSRCVLANPHSL